MAEECYSDGSCYQLVSAWASGALVSSAALASYDYSRGCMSASSRCPMALVAKSATASVTMHK